MDCPPNPSSNVVTVFVGSSSVTSSSGSTYGEQIQDSSCDNCSVEPRIQGNDPNAIFGLLNDALQWGLNWRAANDRSVPVYAHMTANANGSISVFSLTVDNTQTGAMISVMQTRFSVPGRDNSLCLSINRVCLSQAPYSYNIQPGENILPQSIQTVNVVPSGYSNNPSNTFFDGFTIEVTLGNVLTGGVYKPISVTIQP